MAGLVAGRMTDRVTIERRNVIDNARGGRKTVEGEAAWIAIGPPVWAECVPLRGSEALDHLVQRAKQLWRVTIHARRGLSPDMRLTWTDPLLGPVIANITALSRTQTGDGIVIACESGVAG